MICHNLYPARGRKPISPAALLPNLPHLPQPLPRKGTETHDFLWFGLPFSIDLPQPLPRKGTETFKEAGEESKYRTYLPQPLPRKGTETEVVAAASASCLLNLPQPLPRKGTETLNLVIGMIRAGKFATTFTPQGDGNR